MPFVFMGVQICVVAMYVCLWYVCAFVCVHLLGMTCSASLLVSPGGKELQQFHLRWADKFCPP